MPAHKVEADVAVFEQLARQGKLKDDATGICLRVTKM
jgi:hypothetical protein